MPVYGTCAGLIMLADTVLDGIAGQQSLGGLDIAVRRNAFGNQLDSFETDLDDARPRRAAGARGVHPGAGGRDSRRRRRRARRSAGRRVVAVEQGNLLGTAFHPEITGDYRFHHRFLDNVRRA